MTNIITILKCNQISLSIIVFFFWMCSISCSCPLGFNSLNCAPIFWYNLRAYIAPLCGLLYTALCRISVFNNQTSCLYVYYILHNSLHKFPFLLDVRALLSNSLRKAHSDWTSMHINNCILYVTYFLIERQGKITLLILFVSSLHHL